MDEIFENILNGLKLKSNVSQFVQDNKDLIIETFERLESKNIRTLKFALKRFEELCKKIEEHICDKGYSINNRNKVRLMETIHEPRRMHHGRRS